MIFHPKKKTSEANTAVIRGAQKKLQQTTAELIEAVEATTICHGMYKSVFYG